MPISRKVRLVLWIAVLLVTLGLTAGCGGRDRDTTHSSPETVKELHPGAKHFTPEAVNELHPGMSEEEIVAALGQWDERGPDMDRESSSLEYDTLANNPNNDFVVLQISLKKRQLVQATLRTRDYQCECKDSFRPRSPGPQCDKDWAKSCLTLLTPPAKICAAADWPARSFVEGQQRLELVFDPVERQPANAEDWSRLLETRIEGYGRVHLVWQSGGWRVQSACIKGTGGDLGNRLPARDMRQEISEALQSMDLLSTESAPPP
jgi:hypothetical protein